MLMESLGSSNHTLLSAFGLQTSLHSPPDDLIQSHLLNSPCLDYPQMYIFSFISPLNLVTSSLLTFST